RSWHCWTVTDVVNLPASTLTPGEWLLVEDADFVSFVAGSGDDDADGALFRKCWAAIRAARGARRRIMADSSRVPFWPRDWSTSGRRAASRSPRADRR